MSTGGLGHLDDEGRLFVEGRAIEFVDELPRKPRDKVDRQALKEEDEEAD